MKPWYQSKTLWLNVLGGVILLAQYVGTLPGLDPKYTETALIIGNILIRFKTNTAVKI